MTEKNIKNSLFSLYLFVIHYSIQFNYRNVIVSLYDFLSNKNKIWVTFRRSVQHGIAANMS